MASKDMLCLFDIDGTLTNPRQIIDKDMMDFLRSQIMPRCAVGLVGGSDLLKIKEQMGGDTFSLCDFDYIFAENGLISFKNGKQIAKQSISKYLGEEKSQQLINFSLEYMSKLKLPVKRGTFIEYRTGLINLCPVGRSCTQEERLQFAKYDAESEVRKKFIKSLEENLSHLGLNFCIGGQISIDVFPKGWDKTYCLQFVQNDFKEKIYFFGDKTEPGGNDYELFSDSRVIGSNVTSPDDTKQKLKILFNI